MTGSHPEVVVVGGGVVGAAVLFELARRGIRGLLLEKGRFSAESTDRSAAIVRMHYSNAPVVRMALRSREIFQRFHELTGGSRVYYEIGWTFVVPPEDAAKVRANAEMTRIEGVDVREIRVEEARELFPGLSGEGIGAVFLEESSGFAEPHGTTLGYIEGACRLGAEAREGVSVLRLLRAGDGVRGIETPEGEIETGCVVLAAGPWSAKLAATAGLELPFEATREQELYLEVPRATRPKAVMSTLVDCVYLRPLCEWDGRNESAMILGRGFPKEYERVDPDAYAEDVSPEFEEDVRERLGRRLPGLETAGKTGGTSGLYDVTPDWHPYLGSVDGFEGLVLATGGSGHCFKLAPAIGEMIAAQISGEAVDYADIALFSLSRIERGELLGATIGGNRA